MASKDAAIQSPDLPAQPLSPATKTGGSGGYTVLARRYRPMQFDECIGQEHVTRSLENAIQHDRVAHAYLFTGARGVGKTSTARIFARALNCSRGPTARPCGECDICQSIAVGDDVDVIEIDGASNRGIDEVRELRQSVNYRPSRSRYKIYIIDEVHMLTKEAFNALLKTLEEPPPHAKFLFATTEPQKIPVTILSRCQRFDFAGIEVPKIVKRLEEIIVAEGMSADAEALEIIARRAGGSMRDSQSLLDQLLAFGPERLTAADVHHVMGTAGDERVMDLAAAIFAADPARCLQQLQDGVAASVQLGEWVEQMLDYFRDLMALSVAPEAPLVSMPQRHRAAMTQQARALATERLLEMMDLLAACRSRMRGSTYGRTLFEMTVVRLCMLDQFVNLAAVLTHPPQQVKSSSAGAASPAAETSDVEHSTAKQGDSDRGNHEPAARPDDQPQAADADSLPPPKIELTAETVKTFWNHVVDRLGDAVMAAMLQTVRRVEYREPNTIVAEFPAGGVNAKSHCEHPQRMAKINDTCSALGGKPITVRFVLSQSDAADSGVSRPGDYAKRIELARADPIIRKAEEVLGARMLGAPQQVPRTASRVQETEPEVTEP